MKVHVLDIDSGERDPILYPDPSDYTMSLTNPVYDVSKITLVSARVHNSQLLIHDRNNTFTFNDSTSDYEVVLPNGNYDGDELAQTLETSINTAVGGSNFITSNAYDSSLNTITLGATNAFTFKFYDGTNGYTSTGEYTTPHDVLGLPARNVSSTGTSITTGSLNLQGVDAFVLRLSSGSDEFNKTIYSATPFYTGRILVRGDVINFSSGDDTVEHNFDSGSKQKIDDIRVQFFYSSHNRLIPYDFRNVNHVLKLAIACSTGKAETVPRVEKDFSLPAPMHIPDLEHVNRWDAFVSIFLIVSTCVVLLLAMKKPSA